MNEPSRIERQLAKKNHKKEGLKLARKLDDQRPILREKLYADAKKNLDSTMGIFSLSRRWNSTLMWAHYTHSHSGFCIGFDREHEFFKTNNSNKNPKKFIFKPVIYSDKRILIPNRQKNKIEKIDLFLTKSMDWKYEEEERIITSLLNATKVIDTEEVSLSLFYVPHNAIKEIILGMRSSVQLLQNASKLAKKLAIPLYKADISLDSFDVIRNKIKVS